MWLLSLAQGALSPIGKGLRWKLGLFLCLLPLPCVFADTLPPVCDGAPAFSGPTLGVDGTAADNQAGDSGISTVALAGGATNVTLTVTPFAPGAASVSFRAVQTSSALNGQAIVAVTDLSGRTCNLSVTFRNVSAGAVTDEPVCSGLGILMKATGTAGATQTAACSMHLPTSTDPAIPAGYLNSPSSDPSPCLVTTIQSPISGTVAMTYEKGGSFDGRLRLLFSRFQAGSFPPFTDVTQSVEPFGEIDPTRIKGPGTWSLVKTHCAINPSAPPVSVPALSEKGLALLVLLFCTAGSLILRRRRSLV